MAARIVGLGAGGHARVLLEALKAGGGRVAALLDTRTAMHGTSVFGVRVLGGDERLADLRRRGVRKFFVGVGSAGEAGPRRRAFERGLRAGMEPLSIVHPKAVVSPSAVLGPGTAVMAGAVVNAGAMLGKNVIVNTRAVVEHDCRVGDHAHVSSGAVLCGGVNVGPEAHVGAGAVVRQGISVGRGALVAAGAAVVEDVPAGAVVAGVPARRMRRR